MELSQVSLLLTKTALSPAPELSVGIVDLKKFSLQMSRTDAKGPLYILSTPGQMARCGIFL